jgi:plasmid replication initiation protein
MAKPGRLTLMARDAFAGLPLHEKNAYLQTLAKEFAAANGREAVELDKDALARLRRYYLRRVWADLKLPKENPSALDQALASLGESVRMQAVEADMAGALKNELPPKRVLRAPPENDAQLMFFVPAIYDAPIKDDVNLMDVAPFSLAKNRRTGVIRYELKDSLITIEGGAESGLATVFDYDIFLNMVSYLAEEVRRYRQEEARGLRPSLPARSYRPNSSHILKFCRRSDGGKAYDDLEAALDRLTKTTIKVVNLSGGKRRQVDSRPLIGGYQVVSRTGTNKIDQVEITIPDWVYQSVVRADKALPLLTLNEDYFLISSGLGRFIYRLARKAAGKTEARYSVRELHKRSGSSQELRKFIYDLKQLVSRTEAFPMPDYDLSLQDGQEGPVLTMKRRTDEDPQAQPPALDRAS